MKAILASVLVLVSANAFADQCAYVSKVQAEKALKIFLETNKISTLCEPCGETAPTAIRSVTSAGIKYTGTDKYWVLEVNGKEMDLAYTYVNDANLANLVSCPASGVSKSL